MKQKKILIITSSGGGGLIQTANAKEQQARQEDPSVSIVRKDFLKDWVPMGSVFANVWNQAQRTGNVSIQQIVCVNGQPLWDFVLYPLVFFKALRTFFQENVDHVIDTQPMGTSAILRAMRFFNWKRKKDVRMEKVLVDLPTKKATHFLTPIKKLSKRNRKALKLVSIAPLLDEGETAEQFWQSTSGLSESEISYEDTLVRQAFRERKNQPRPQGTIELKVHFKNPDELKWMRASFEKGSIQAHVQASSVNFQIHPQDRVVTLLLGSQPAKEATINYVKNMIAAAKQFPQKNIHLFVFCADHPERGESLLKEVAKTVAHCEDYPKHLSVIPFSFQTEQVIALLFHRSDATCTRSGGQTAMELMSVSTGRKWIHSEAKKGQNLLDGIPGWEAASAIYLQKLHGAEIITPESFNHHVSRIYTEELRNAL